MHFGVGHGPSPTVAPTCIYSTVLLEASAKASQEALSILVMDAMFSYTAKRGPLLVIFPLKSMNRRA